MPKLWNYGKTVEPFYDYRRFSSRSCDFAFLPLMSLQFPVR